MFLYGASGHCKVVIDAIESSSNNTIEAIFDDNPKSDFISGIPVIIATSKLLQKSKNFIDQTLKSNQSLKLKRSLFLFGRSYSNFSAINIFTNK